MEAKRSDPNKCQERVWSSNFYSHQCTRDIKVTREGKGYCTVHDPVRRREKIDAKYEDYKLESDKRKQEFDKVKKLKENYPILLETLKEAMECLKGTSNPYWRTIEQVLKEGEII